MKLKCFLQRHIRLPYLSLMLTVLSGCSSTHVDHAQLCNIGISLDSKEANWKKAVHDDKMPWTQLSDLKGWKNVVSADFGIQSIPSNLLIDPSGKIIARDIKGAMLENKLKQLMN